MLVYLIAFVTIPFMICCVVLDFEKIRVDNVNLSIYGFCWLGIVLNCITGYHDNINKEFVMDPDKIFKFDLSDLNF